MTASKIAFRASILFIFVGIALGMYMGASHNHAPAPVHAHINLVGFVSLFLLALFYERRDEINRSKLAIGQVIAWTIGAIILNFAVAMLYFGQPALIVLAPVGEIIVALSSLVFGFILFKATASA